MNVDDLANELRRPYSIKTGYGITKLRNPPKQWEHIYFVVPKPPIRKIPTRLPHKLLSDALRVIGSLPSLEKMGELDRLINYLFVRREVVQSSRLEGTWSTIDHVLTPGDMDEDCLEKNEHQAVRSYAKILEDIIEKTKKEKTRIFTRELICEVHRRIVENDPNSRGLPGKLRTEGELGSIVTIGGGLRKENSIYNPAPAFAVEKSLEEVLKWLRDDQLAQLGDAAVGGFSLPVRIAIAHAHFEAVHPFTDGNGRAGRALWPIQMVCSGYMPLYLSGHVEFHKDKYITALENAQKKLNYIPIIEFICHAIIDSSLENQKTKAAILKLETTWQERGKFRANSGAKRSLRLLLEKPIISTAILEKELGLSKTASVDTINALAKKKIVRLRKTEKRTRIYAAEELIQILSRPFGDEIELAIEKAHRLMGLRY